MWFEILPSAVIITAALSIPGYAMYGIHKLVLGNAYRRNLDARFDRVMYLRDRRLADNPYIMHNEKKLQMWATYLYGTAGNLLLRALDHETKEIRGINGLEQISDENN